MVEFANKMRCHLLQSIDGFIFQDFCSFLACYVVIRRWNNRNCPLFGKRPLIWLQRDSCCCCLALVSCLINENVGSRVDIHVITVLSHTSCWMNKLNMQCWFIPYQTRQWSSGLLLPWSDFSELTFLSHLSNMKRLHENRVLQKMMSA